MYILKDDVKVKINQTKASKVIGLTQPTLSNILNRKVTCKKSTAFCIVKYIDVDADINKYFKEIKKGY